MASPLSAQRPHPGAPPLARCTADVHLTGALADGGRVGALAWRRRAASLPGAHSWTRTPEGNNGPPPKSSPTLVGATITTWKILDRGRRAPLAPRVFRAALVGGASRHCAAGGKYLDWASMMRPTCMHLRMTGTLLLDSSRAASHTRVDTTLDGVRPAFVDPCLVRALGQLVVGQTRSSRTPPDSSRALRRTPSHPRLTAGVDQNGASRSINE